MIPAVNRSKKKIREVFKSWAEVSAIGPPARNLPVNDTMVGKPHLCDAKDILVKLNCSLTRGFSAPEMYSQLVIYFKIEKRKLE